MENYNFSITTEDIRNQELKDLNAGGPISFIKFYDEITKRVSQEGAKRKYIMQ